MTSPLEISATALTAQRVRMNVLASNIANVNTTRDAHGNNVPYKRLDVVFAAREGNDEEGYGVQVADIRHTRDPWKWVYQPDHPDAVRDPSSEHHGQVQVPRISVVQEMVDMMLASRAYEANRTVMQVSKSMGESVSRIIA